VGFGEMLGFDLAGILAAMLCIPGVWACAGGISLIVFRPANTPISRARVITGSALIAIGALLALAILAYVIGLTALFYFSGRG
jgi:hypothetical protein